MYAAQLLQPGCSVFVTTIATTALPPPPLPAAARPQLLRRGRRLGSPW